MKSLSVASTVAILFASNMLQSSSGFVVLPQSSTKSTTAAAVTKSSSSSSSLQMGLFDFFSPEARKEREEQKQREIEEQERRQRLIMERRRNPEKMEEYEAKVRVRRALRMKGQDEAADKVELFDKNADAEEFN